MALRNIVVEGDPILRKTCRPVDKVDDRIRMILDDMIETMHDACGVGLAAPQIGMMRRMFVAEPEEGEIYCFVNPEIITVEGEQECIEGCLSVPGYQGNAGDRYQLPVPCPQHEQVHSLRRLREGLQGTSGNRRS